MEKVTCASIRKSKEGYQLIVNGEPFYINGAGLEFGNVGDAALHGANSFRTWRVENGKKSGKEVLDAAHNYGLKVMMGIEVARERHGFDYDDRQAVHKQLEEIKADVIALRDHPALLIWGIGNELNLHATNPKVWNAVNEISEMIHEQDPNHPTTTSLAGLDEELSDEIVERAPDLDILSIQLYGAIDELPKTLRKVSWKGPVIISEWGATGYWEVPNTKWEAPIEDDSTTKAQHFKSRYDSSIASLNGQCIGSYVFLWGQKQERTSTWFGLYTAEGKKTETVQVMHEIWKEETLSEACPKVVTFSLDGKKPEDNIVLKPAKTYEAFFETDSEEGIAFRWEILRESTAKESGGDKEEVPEIVSKSSELDNGKFEIVSPKEKGPYRLYFYAESLDGYVAHANIPFFVD